MAQLVRSCHSGRNGLPAAVSFGGPDWPDTAGSPVLRYAGTAGTATCWQGTHNLMCVSTCRVVMSEGRLGYAWTDVQALRCRACVRSRGAAGPGLVRKQPADVAVYKPAGPANCWP